MVKKIRKRDGSVVFFQADKIENAIWKAAKAVGGKDRERSKVLADLVVEKLDRIHGEHGIPEVEEVQDMVEKVLIEEGHAKESLEIKRKAIENFTKMGLYPYTKFYLRQVHQRFGEYWKNHFATIGLLGMNEAILNFMPGEDITTEKGRAFSIKILDFMRDRLSEYQEETGNIYNLEATPGEGTTYRFARMDKKRFGRIIVANEDAFAKGGAKPYYTNSSQLPVGFTDDVFEALDIQDELQCKYTGGTVFHTFVGEKMTIDSVKKMVKKISSNYHLPYFTLTPTFSICPIHGYLNGEHEYCPKCDLEIEQAEETPISNAEKIMAEESEAEGDIISENSVEEPKMLVAPSIVVDGDTVTVVESSDSKLNIGGDTNGENEV